MKKNLSKIVLKAFAFSFLLPFCSAVPADTGSITVNFAKDEVIRLQGIKRNGWKGNRYGDNDRLVYDKKSSASSRYAVIDIDNFSKGAIAKTISLYLIVNSLSPSTVNTKIAASASTDGINYLPVKLTPDKKHIPLKDGNNGITLRGPVPGRGARFIKLEIKDMGKTPYWKLQLARLDIGATRSSIKPTKGFSGKFDFSAKEILKRENMKFQTWKAKERGDDSRLVVSNRPGGSVVCDTLVFSSGAKFFKLGIITHGYGFNKISELVTVAVSNDGEKFTKVKYKQIGKIDKRATGFAYLAIGGEYSYGFRFIRVAVSCTDMSKSWKLQLADLTVSNNNPAKNTVGKNITYGPAKKAAQGIMLELLLNKPINTGKDFNLFVSTDGKTYHKVRYLLGGPDKQKNKWLKYTVLYGAGKAKFRYARITQMKKTATWKLKTLKSSFIDNWKAYLKRFNRPPPSYTITTKENNYKISNTQAALFSDETKAPLCWQNYCIPDEEKRAFRWSKMGLIHSPSTKYKGVAYRFAIKPENLPHDDILLKLQRSAFVTELYVNSKKVADSQEGLLPIEFNLTPFLISGKENLIELRVYDYRKGFNEKSAQILPMGAMFKYSSGLVIPPVIAIAPKVRASDTFVISDTSAGTVTISTEVKNSTSKSCRGTVMCAIRDKRGKVLFKNNTAYSVQAGKTELLKFKFKVDNKLKMWDIGKPNLYFADLEITAPEQPIQKTSTRFGYRTVKVKGEDIYLNGHKIRMIGPWAHIGEWTYRRYYKGKRLTPKEFYEAMLSKGLNYGRLHCQPFPEEFYDAADEAGFLLIAESGLAHRPANQASLDHVARMVKYLRNHPSIIIWSGSNEFGHWLVPRPPEVMDFLVKVMKTMKNNDPTRPVQHSGFGDAWGKLDIYNIHYPCESTAYPYCLYWKNDPDRMTLQLYNDNYSKFNPVGKKPIGYGEHAIPSAGRNMSYYSGEPGLKALYSKSPDSRKKTAAIQGENWRQRIRAAREQNIAIISPNILYFGLDSPFVENISKECKPVGAYMKLRSPVMRSGTNEEITLITFDDAGNGFSGSTEIKVESAGKELYIRKLLVNLLPGELKSQTVLIPLPPLLSDQYGTLSVKLKNTNGKTVYTDNSKLKLYRARDNYSPLNYRLAVIGGNDKLNVLLKNFGITVNKVKDLHKFLSTNPQIPLLIASETDPVIVRSCAMDLEKYVKKGGRILSLEFASFPTWLPVDARPTNNKANCIGFIRVPKNPLFSNSDWKIENIDLKYWGNDWKISASGIQKPTAGSFHSLIDGGTDLEDTFLLTLPRGSGFYLCSQLELNGKYSTVPQAKRLLYNLLKALSRKKSTPLSLGAYIDTPDSYTSAYLKSIGMKPGRTGGNCLVVPEDSIKKYGLKNCLSTAKKYHNVLFFNLRHTNVTAVARALTETVPGINNSPFKAKLIFDSSPNSIYSGLTSRDLNWMQKTEGAYRFASAGNWKTSIIPGLDAVFSKKNGGKIVFLNLPFNKDVPDSEHKRRFISELLTNLGVATTGKRVKNYNPDAKIIPLDISRQANVAISKYLGEKAPKGNITLNEIPFKFLSSGNSMIRLNGRCGTPLEGKKILYDTPIDRFTQKTPDSIKIPLNGAQADIIYFAHAATRNWKCEAKYRKGSQVCIYKINYTDGSSVQTPVVFEINIGICRSPAHPSKAKIATIFPNTANGAGERAAIYLWEMDNPFPERKISNIEIISGKNPFMDPMIFGISIKKTDKTFF